MPSLQLSSGLTPISGWSGDCLILGCFQTDDGIVWPAGIEAIDASDWEGAIAELAAETEFKAKAGSTAATRIGRAIRKVVLVGLGKADKFATEILRNAAAAGLRKANSLKAKTVAFAFPDSELEAEECLQAMAEGVLLVAHRDVRFKSGTENGNGCNIESAVFLGLEPNEPALARAREVAAGTILARELVAAPANIVTPLALADAARAIAVEYGLDVEVLGWAECEALGMGAFLGVAQASDLPPQFIHLTYRPVGEPKRRLAIIGKGVTFDSGGLNLKTSMASIGMMKTDMGGAAATLGAARAIAALKPNAEVHFIVAATENMISGRALHPGDILTASNQKTIEINNTDAEGRLTLADALVFADKLELDAIVDLATLTGAIMVALGKRISGLFTPDEALAAELKAAAERSGEQIWQMPLEDSYAESLSSVVADMKNTGSRDGGSISAALFLQRFVDKTPWAHLDIAGTVWTDKDYSYHNKGATGYGVRTLVEWVLA
ncbi:leucyl aminopeptidase [Synechococcus sp. PCC 7336]|uniref:leucyl aminopeptidase n=1 Tax=Synechococcus sp. PCC 7336 TaxID=195250 RepID=UPI0005700729|nr:leucyl aminopeptidase [Synechococcus sp. PCC 7336]